VFLVNGSLSDDVTIDNDYAFYSKEFSSGLTVIDRVELTAEPPVPGRHSSFEPKVTLVSGAGCWAANAFWHEKTPYANVLLDDEVFVQGKDYGVSIFLAAQKGYVFSEHLTVVVNGKILSAESIFQEAKRTVLDYFFGIECVQHVDGNADGLCDVCGALLPPPAAEVPVTGDATPVALYLAACFLSAAMLFGSLRRLKAGR